MPIRRLLLAAVLILIPSVAQAHTAEELDAWVADWEERAGIYPTDRALAELRDMMFRHHAPPPPVQTSPQNATSAISGDSGGTNRGMGNGNVGQWESLVAAYFPADQVDTALRIIACESGGNPSADNPRSSAAGLFQVLGSLWAPHFGVSADDLYDPETNTRLAYEIWKMSGWGAWSCY